MKKDSIVFKTGDVQILGYPVGPDPHEWDFKLAFAGQSLRTTGELNRRELIICDALGLSYLVELNSQLVLWLSIALGPLSTRQNADRFPLGFFKGKILIGPYTVQGPFSTETGELIRKLEFPEVSISLVPEGKQIRALSASFRINEKMRIQR